MAGFFICALCGVMGMRYDKPGLTVRQQVELLVSRGLMVQDRACAEAWRHSVENLLADREPWQLRAMGFPDDWREHPLWTGAAATAPEEGKP